jgi:O-antigen ligase
MTLDQKAHPWHMAIALFGSLYFVGIGLGYLSFAQALPDFRLRYTLAGLFVIVVALRFFVLIRFRQYTTRLAAVLYGLLASMVLVQALWFVPITNAGGMEIYLSTVGDTVVSSGILAITGETVGKMWRAGKTSGALWPVGIALTACVSTIGLGVSLGWSLTAEMQLLFQSQTGETLYNYLALGDSIALLGLLMMGLFNRPTFRLAVLVIAAVALFFAYSRTSFFLFLVCSIFILFIGARNSQRFGLAALVAIVVSVLIAVAGESDALQPAIERMTVLLFNREADESYVARKVIFSEGLEYLKENWVIGRFLDEWWREGVGGGYIHNWLSFWQAYGLVPFLASLYLFGACGLALWKQLPNPSRSTGTAISLWMYAILAIITSRAYTWPFLWLAFGFITSVTYARSDENRVSAPLA